MPGKKGRGKTGGVTFRTRYKLRSWRRDVNFFISQLSRGVTEKASMWDIKKANTPVTAKPEHKSMQANQLRLGPSMLVKGEISGNEDLLIDGSVEGIVRLNERKLFVGPAANVKADIIAGQVIVRGTLKGNVCARYRIEIGNEGSVIGDLITPQVLIEDGAWFKDSIEIEKSEGKQGEANALSETKSAPAKAVAAAVGGTNS